MKMVGYKDWSENECKSANVQRKALEVIQKG